MERLKNPPFYTTFTRVRVIPVSPRGKAMTLFFPSKFHNRIFWDIKGTEGKTEAYGKFPLNLDLKIGHKWHSLFKSQENSASICRFVDEGDLIAVNGSEAGHILATQKVTVTQKAQASSASHAPVPTITAQRSIGRTLYWGKVKLLPWGSADRIPRSLQGIHRATFRKAAGSKAT